MYRITLLKFVNKIEKHVCVCVGGGDYDAAMLKLNTVKDVLKTL